MLKLWVVTGALRSTAPGTERLAHRLRANQGSIFQTWTVYRTDVTI